MMKTQDALALSGISGSMVHHIPYIVNLRAVSALLVLIYHHCQFFWLHQQFCGRLANSPPVNQVPWIAKFLDSLPINLGDLGVATFFLISGFLMPLVAQSKTRKSFIKGRIRRIWPPYLLSFLLLLFIVYINSEYHLRQFPWKPDHILASLLMIRDIIGYPFIDGIVWTLEIEIKFYFLCFLALTWLSHKPINFLVLIVGLSILSLLLMKLNLLDDGTSGTRMVDLFFKTTKFICFIGVGTAISYIFQNNVTKTKGIALIILLFLSYGAHLFWFGVTKDSLNEMNSYVCALVIFVVCYFFRNTIKSRGLMG